MSSVTDILDDNYKKLYKKMHSITGKRPDITLNTIQIDPIKDNIPEVLNKKEVINTIQNQLLNKNTYIIIFILFLVIIFFSYTQPDFITYKVSEHQYKINYIKLFMYSLSISIFIYLLYYYYPLFQGHIQNYLR